ncbi:phage tail sheath family protein [Spirosoma panaciterrae]|uniref:phage tail sheath family protein n=1 Tax=Spirosoma panaciterrae TaxID=496058 RepID=UPI00036915BF|nr:phage tail sheath C-terminal domain-containing protein [Spirosoma panaciterrae]
MNYQHPGVYIEEIPKFPPSIAAVETAIPVFIGYTEKITNSLDESLLLRPIHITSLLEYENLFGYAAPETGIKVEVRTKSDGSTDIIPKLAAQERRPYNMYYSLQLFYGNGGGDCYIISVGDYTNGAIEKTALLDGLEASDQQDEITLIVFPDAQNLPSTVDYYDVYKQALDKCAGLKDRFTVMDVYKVVSDTANLTEYIDTNIQALRNAGLGEIDTLKYGAAYFPNLNTSLDFAYDEATVDVTGVGALAELKSSNNALYFRVKSAIQQMPVEMPPSGAVVGIYASVDNSRGVWKAPANVNIDFVIGPVIDITDKRQDGLNVDPVAGKSVNVIRSFRGRGPALIWGARTLAGNDNEWRYVPVRRFFIMVEESAKNAAFQFVFEPNDTNTWVRVRSMIENFLVQQWKAGALMGTTAQQAFYVRVGLNETMSAIDILEGRMNVEIGMAVVRPAEFIILKFSHKMPEVSAA